MKYINLDSLLESTTNLPSDTYENYLKFLGIEFDRDELTDLSKLLSTLKRVRLINTDNFFVGYTIQQISKQFDLLRVGTDNIVNIELKRTSTPEKIKKQLTQNRYYLQFLGLNMYTFTYVSDTNEIYSLDNQNNLVLTTPQYLIDILTSQELKEIHEIDTLFKPSNYLVSPFNSTDKFIRTEYFLTEHQNNIKNTINTTFTSPNAEFVAITGKPGTGKTLLTFDLANHYRTLGLNVVIVHCGKLNDGHFTLRDKFGWRIYSIKYFDQNHIVDFDVLIVDEAQRLKVSQFSMTLNNA